VRLLTVGSLPPEWGGPLRGGVATFHAALLEGILRRGGEVEPVGVLAPSAPHGATPLPIFARPNGTGTAEFYASLLERLQPDVVLLNHVAHTIGVTHARLAGAPPALGVAHSWHNITFRSGEERHRARAVTEEALAGLAALVCPSRHCAREGADLGLAYPAVAETIHYPLQPLYEEAELDAAASGEERSGVLFVGSLVERKNPFALLEAAVALPGLELTLVGEGEAEDELRESIGRRGLPERVRLAQLPGREHLRRLRELFLRSQVLCLPSRSESFGIVFIEALACGTPVVGFGPTVREIGEAMGIEIGVPLDDPTPAAIAAAIEAAIAADWDRAALRRAAVASFGLDRATERYVDLLGSCR